MPNTPSSIGLGVHGVFAGLTSMGALQIPRVASQEDALRLLIAALILGISTQVSLTHEGKFELQSHDWKADGVERYSAAVLRTLRQHSLAMLQPGGIHSFLLATSAKYSRKV